MTDERARHARGWAAYGAVAVVAVAGTLSAAGTASGTPGAPDVAFPALEWANDPACVPDPAHPDPVLLVHGTWGEVADLEDMGRALGDEGFCVHAVEYGHHQASLAGLVPGTYAIGEMDASAEAIDRAIRYVASETDAGVAAGKVDVLGHSQGAALIKLAMNDHGAAEVVDDAIYLAGTHKGTAMRGIDRLGIHSNSGSVAVSDAILGPAALQQVNGSDVVAHLRSLPDTQPGVDYTVLISADDDTATPAPEAFLEEGPGATATNVLIQDVCPDAPQPLTHDGMRDEPVVHGLIAAALAGRPVVCD